MHNQAANAYARVARAVANPRELEARALLKASAMLQTIHDKGPETGPELLEALVFNRRLWTIFASGAADETNGMDPGLRAEVTSLAAFVLSRTIDSEVEPTREAIASIIGINRNIAAGLMGSAG